VLLLALAIATLLMNGSAAAAQDLSGVACRPDTPVAELGARVTLRAFAQKNLSGVTYRWRVSAGTIEGDGPTVQWVLPTQQPQAYVATVDLRRGARSGSCTLQVLALRSDPQRGTEIRRQFLAPTQQEQAGLHLYSYLLLGSPPSDDVTRQRYLVALRAYLSVSPLPEGIVSDADLNVTFLPVKERPRTKAETSAEWLLEQYDWERARFFLRRLPGDRLGGPYIFSSRQPLSQVGVLQRDYLDQDLSIVPPELVNAWVREFMLQSAQEQFWNERTGPMLALKVRTIIGVLAAGLPRANQAIAIVWH
jgi:hypothetical protein